MKKRKAITLGGTGKGAKKTDQVIQSSLNTTRFDKYQNLSQELFKLDPSV
jgi:hypothetical protein